jgi:phenylpyruvate tautomerase PptA (4-oxalocrotonate tautomerase family)
LAASRAAVADAVPASLVRGTPRKLKADLIALLGKDSLSAQSQPSPSELTKFHSEYAGVPGNWVHIVFQDYAPGSGFTAGRAFACAALTLLIRSGRSPDYKRGLLKRLWELFQDATGAPDDQIVIGIQEVPPSPAMEMAQIMPDVFDQ